MAARGNEQTLECQHPSVLQHHIGMARDLAHRAGLDGDAAGLQLRELLRIGLEAAVEQQGGRAPIGQQQRLMQRQRRAGQHTDAALLQLIPVAIGAMEHMPAPALRQPRHLGQRVDHARGQHQPPGQARRPALDLHPETLLRTLRAQHLGVQPFDRGIGHELRARHRRDVGALAAVLGQETMGMLAKAVAPLAGIDHQQLAPGARQGKRGGQAGVAATNDQSVIEHEKSNHETYGVS